MLVFVFLTCVLGQLLSLCLKLVLANVEVADSADVADVLAEVESLRTGRQNISHLP